MLYTLRGGGVKHHQVQRMHMRWFEEMYQTKGTEGKVLSMMPLLVWNCVLADQRWGWRAEEWCYRSTGCLHSYIPLSSLELYWFICFPFPVKPIAALQCPLESPNSGREVYSKHKTLKKTAMKVTRDFEAGLLQANGSWRVRWFGISRTGCQCSLGADGLF